MLLAVLVYGYCIVLVVIFCGTIWPASLWGFGIAGVLLMARKGKKLGLALTAHGTAFWAGLDELLRAGMIDARSGLILGRMLDSAKAGLMAGIKALFNGKLKARDACRQFFAAFRREPPPLVRLPQAITTVCFAPPGAGKSTGLVIPFLLTCDESCVVLDFSGELALATAEARRRMGHEIIILDPYKVVTQ